MPRRVELLREGTIFQKAIFRIDEAELRFERFEGGMSKPVVRLSVERGDSAACVVHDLDTDEILFTEQFRYPAHRAGHSWLLELPAGVVDSCEDPAKALQRELLEEIGYRADELHSIASFFVTPGGSSERIHLFYAAVRSRARVDAGGGVEEEGEDIRVLRLPVEEAVARASRGEIVDAKTIIGLQWLALRRGERPG